MLAFALVLIFVLWLIDKHNMWRAAAKIFFGLMGLAVLGLAGVWSWGKYESRKEEKAQAFSAAQREAEVKACVKRFSAKGVFDTGPCELDPSAQPQPPVNVNDWGCQTVRWSRDSMGTSLPCSASEMPLYSWWHRLLGVY